MGVGENNRMLHKNNTKEFFLIKKPSNSRQCNNNGLFPVMLFTSRGIFDIAEIEKTTLGLFSSHAGRRVAGG